MKPKVKSQKSKCKRQKAGNWGPGTGDRGPEAKTVISCQLSGVSSQYLTPSTQHLAWSLTFALCLLLSASTHAFAQENGSAPQKNPYTGNAAAIVEGQELYKKMNCYGCHGMQGGGGMGPSLIDEAWKTGTGTDLNLLDQIRNGKGQMPPYKTMVNDDQAWKLIAFIRSLYKGDPKKIVW
jgi:cytochrome c(L)